MSALDSVLERIERARLSVDGKLIIKLVAISKYTDSENIKRLYLEGQRAFGESRVQDLKEKERVLQELPLEWHFIGRLQNNKINQLIELKPHLLHSLDTIELASELDKRLKAKNRTMRCLLQVNSAKEESKAGFMPQAATDAYKSIKESCTNIQLMGVMSIGAHTDDIHAIQKSFEVTKKIYDDCSGASILSMGMSSDFELAIKCGANMVRIGSILF